MLSPYSSAATKTKTSELKNPGGCRTIKGGVFVELSMIEIKDLSFAHENGREIFTRLRLNIPRGQVTAIMGPSGTGKTTLLRLIGAQLQPVQGEILINGQNIHAFSRKQLYQWRQSLGFLFQSGGLFTHLNVYENVAFALREHTSLSESLLHSLVMIKLQMVGLRGAARLMPNQLSGGMARRVALARAIALDPQLILYDEPFTGQDPITMGVLMQLIRTLNDALGLTSIIVSHDVQETLKIADYVYVISEQQIIGQGTPQEIIQHKSAKLQQFIQGLPDGPVAFAYPASSLEKDLFYVS
jgi:phospholipid/cholesterol/gamma-HCH transport system ATP-binding protein